MSNKVTGAFLLLLIGGLTLLGGKFLLAYLEEREQRMSSDAAATKGRIRLAVDSWVGYFPLCSPEMKREMRQAGWLLECIDDQADYRGRMEGLEKGDYDLVVATVDSYLLAGKAVGYPGAVVAVIDESKGGDALVARKSKIANLNAVRSASDVRVAFTADSPSHFLLKAAASHFDLPALLPPAGPLRLTTEGSAKALEKLLAGTADVAALWEPDVSRALADPALTKLLGTEETERLIVDILIANRRFIQQKPELVSLLLERYFQVLKRYRDNPERLASEVAEQTGIDRQGVMAMLKGVLWQGLLDNCENWFGIAGPGGRGEERLAATLDSTVDILIGAGDFNRSPVPDNDNYRLLNRSFLESLYARGVSGFTRSSGAFQPEKGGLPPLDEAGWAALSEVGTLKLKPISFQHGSTELDLLAGVDLDQAAARLSHYPGFRVVIKGHTGSRGDTQLNLELSQQRAESVKTYLLSKHQLDPNRLRAIGLGGTSPLPRGDNESMRGYEQRLPRVELVLVREAI